MKLSTVLVGGMFAFAVMSVTGPADAAGYVTVTPFSGKTFWPGDATCFGHDGNAGAQNKCTGTAVRTFVWYVPVTNEMSSAPAAWVNIEGLAASASLPIACDVYAYSPGASPYWSGTSYLPLSSTINIGTALASKPLLEVRCGLRFNDKITRIVVGWL